MGRKPLPEEERILRKRESNRIRFQRYSAKGNAVTKSIKLTKDDNEHLQQILDSFSLSFPQFIRAIISGELKVIRSDDKQA